jgi:hypothetical protein
MTNIETRDDDSLTAARLFLVRFGETPHAARGSR